MKRLGKNTLRIVEIAQGKFFQFGFSRVTMEEIAEDAGVSKKTLYEQFASKELLLKAVLDQLAREVEAEARKIILEQKLDFADKVKALLTLLGLRLSRIGRPFMEDLRKYAPERWKEIEELRRRKFTENFGEVLRQGMARGIFRNDIDPQLLLLMAITLINNMVNPYVLLELPYSPGEILEAVFSVFFEGILTGKSRNRLRRKIKNQATRRRRRV
jgi:AcrR family transcriptional regulator